MPIVLASDEGLLPDYRWLAVSSTVDGATELSVVSFIDTNSICEDSTLMT